MDLSPITATASTAAMSALPTPGTTGAPFASLLAAQAGTPVVAPPPGLDPAQGPVGADAAVVEPATGSTNAETTSASDPLPFGAPPPGGMAGWLAAWAPPTPTPTPTAPGPATQAPRQDADTAWPRTPSASVHAANTTLSAALPPATATPVRATDDRARLLAERPGGRAARVDLAGPGLPAAGKGAGSLLPAESEPPRADAATDGPVPLAEPAASAGAPAAPPPALPPVGWPAASTGVAAAPTPATGAAPAPAEALPAGSRSDAAGPVADTGGTRRTTSLPPAPDTPIDAARQPAPGEVSADLLAAAGLAPVPRPQPGDAPPRLPAGSDARRAAPGTSTDGVTRPRPVAEALPSGVASRAPAAPAPDPSTPTPGAPGLVLPVAAAAADLTQLLPPPGQGVGSPGAPAPAAGVLTELVLPTPVESPQFKEALGVQVSVLARDGIQEAELHLNPAEMGPISVRIALDGQRAQVDFGVDSAAMRSLVEAGMPELAAALREAGLTLTGGGVSQHARGDGPGTPGGRPGDGSPHPGADQDGRRARGHGGDAADDLPAPRPRPVRLSGVDLYA